jgi:hypothetical protein
MIAGTCAHLNAISEIKLPEILECEECVKIGRALGALADMSEMRSHALLRRLA